jgi:hypothetical protein
VLGRSLNLRSIERARCTIFRFKWPRREHPAPPAAIEGSAGGACVVNFSVEAKNESNLGSPVASLCRYCNGADGRFVPIGKRRKVFESMAVRAHPGAGVTIELLDRPPRSSSGDGWSCADAMEKTASKSRVR